MNIFNYFFNFEKFTTRIAISQTTIGGINFVKCSVSPANAVRPLITSIIDVAIKPSIATTIITRSPRARAGLKAITNNALA